MTISIGSGIQKGTSIQLGDRIGHGSIIDNSSNSISNLEVHYDARDGNAFQITSFGRISVWHDLSGNGRHAFQTSMLNQPTKGTLFNAPGASFGTTETLLNIPFTYDWTNNPFTIIAVATKRSTTGFRGLIGNRFGAGGANWWTLGQYEEAVFGGRMVVETTTQTISDYGIVARGLPPQIYEYNHDPSGNDTIYLNGTLVDTKAIQPIGGITNFLVLGRWVAASQTWDGLDNEIEIYSKSINAKERADRVACLSSKWQ